METNPWSVLEQKASRVSIDEAPISAQRLKFTDNSAYVIMNEIKRYAKAHFNAMWFTSKNGLRIAFILLAADPKMCQYMSEKLDVNLVFELDSLGINKNEDVVMHANALFKQIQEYYAIGEDMNCIFVEFDEDKPWGNLYEHVQSKLTSVLIGDHTVCETVLGVWNKRFRDLSNSIMLYVVFNMINSAIPDKAVQEKHCRLGRTQLFNYAFTRIKHSDMRTFEAATQIYINTWAKGKADAFVRRLLSEDNPVPPHGLFRQFLIHTTWNTSQIMVDDLGSQCQVVVRCKINGADKAVCPDNSYMCDDE